MSSERQEKGKKKKKLQKLTANCKEIVFHAEQHGNPFQILSIGVTWSSYFSEIIYNYYVKNY